MVTDTRSDDARILELFADSATAEQGFALLVEKYSRRIYWVVRGIVVCHADTDDVVQNVFVKLWREVPRFRGESSLYTWIYRIAVNESLGLLRGRKNRCSVSMDDAHLEHYIDNEGLYDGDRVEQALGRALLRLPAKQRVVFNLRYYEQMPYEQMSQVLDTSQGALKASYHHAMKKVEQWLLDDNELFMDGMR